MQEYIKINGADNVAVALRDYTKGETLSVDGVEVTLAEDIARGHKFTLEALEEGAPVIKYGFPIGYTKEAVKKGCHIHVHNLKTGLGDDLSYEYHPANMDSRVCTFPEADRFFHSYERPDGKVGVRNELWVVSYSHPYGCSQMGDDQENARKALAGLINHPNAGGVLVLGLGCENSNIDVLKPYLGDAEHLLQVRFRQ